MERAADAARDTASPLADPGMRLAAATLDVGAAVGPFFVAVAIGVSAGSPTVLHVGMFSLAVIAWPLLFLNLWWLHRYGQTLGKRVLGLRIVRRDGQRASLVRIFFLRMVVPGIVGLIPVLGAVFSLVDPLFVFGASRRTVHDRLADTIVVDLRRSPDGSRPG